MKPLCPYCSALWTMTHECAPMLAERVATLALDSGYVLGDEPARIYEVVDLATKKKAAAPPA